MLYYIYDTIEEIDEVDTIVCQGQGIGVDPTDVTTNYADAYLIPEGEYANKFGYLCDSVTMQYITDREPVDIIQ